MACKPPCSGREIWRAARRYRAGGRTRQCRAPRTEPHAAAILEGAEAALLRIGHEWRKSRGGNRNNEFFAPLSKRMRRIIGYYRKYAEKAPKPPEETEAAHWVYKIRDFEALPFQRLKPYFRASHVDDAIKTGHLVGPTRTACLAF